VVKNSQLVRENVPAYGVIAEPTCMIPVYAHKGFYQVTVTAHGRAAHTSTGLGVSANLLIAPFLADMAELAKMSQADEKYLNHEFQPPTNGFNMVIDDGGTALNVTAAKTVARVGFRAMPNTPNEELMDMIVSSAEKYGLETVVDMHDSMYVDPGNKIIEVACAITGIEKAQTVPYGTEAIHYQRIIPNLIILGPGDISVAHTIEEFVPIAELEESVNVYRRMIEEFCM
jgi:acetylornithine deacetylase